MSTYQRLDPIERDEATTLLESAESRVVAETILRLARHDFDAQWVTSRAIALIDHPNTEVLNSAATALGHVARRPHPPKHRPRSRRSRPATPSE